MLPFAQSSPSPVVFASGSSNVGLQRLVSFSDRTSCCLPRIQNPDPELRGQTLKSSHTSSNIKHGKHQALLSISSRLDRDLPSFNVSHELKQPKARGSTGTFPKVLLSIPARQEESYPIQQTSAKSPMELWSAYSQCFDVNGQVGWFATSVLGMPRVYGTFEWLGSVRTTLEATARIPHSRRLPPVCGVYQDPWLTDVGE